MKKSVLGIKPAIVSLSKFIEEVEKHNGIVNHQYQRSKVWKRKQQEDLIISVIEGRCIGLFTFKVREDGKWEILDGQQRTNSIFSFIGKYLNEDIGIDEKFEVEGIGDYDTISKDNELRPAFESAPIVYILIPQTLKDDETAKYFIALQNGTPLNKPELLAAQQGYLRDVIAEEDKKPNLLHKTVKPARFRSRYLLSILLLLELEGELKRKPIFSNLRYNDLVDLYEDYRKRNKSNKGKISKKLKIIRANLKVLDILMKGNEKFISGVGYFIPLYCLVSHLEQNYYIYEPKKLKDFIIEFASHIKKKKTKGEYSKFKKLVSGGTTRDSLSARYSILKKALRKKIKNLKRGRDQNRHFEENQKTTIFNNSKRKCFVCENEVARREAAFHHKKYWCMGGRTIINNGVLCHKECHIKFHIENQPDYDI